MAYDSMTEDTIKGHAIRELQGLKQQVVAGTTATTDIALAGATVKKTTLVSVMEYDKDGGGAGVGAFTDRTSEAAITTDGNMQLDTTNTTGTQLLVWSANKP